MWEELQLNSVLGLAPMQQRFGPVKIVVTSSLNKQMKRAVSINVDKSSLRFFYHSTVESLNQFLRFQRKENVKEP